MKKVILSFLLMLTGFLAIKGQETSKASAVPMGLSENISFDQATELSADVLRKSLIQVLNKNNFISVSEGDLFLTIQPSITVITKDITPTAPPMVAMNLDLNLSLINSNDGNVFHSTSMAFKGVGTTDNKAYLNAFRSIRYRQKEVDAFISEAGAKVGRYYDQNCDRILTEINTLKSTGDYDGAIYKLRSIPSFAQNCYAQASSLIEAIYTESLNENCQKYLNIAETAIALRRFDAAAQALIQIDPEAACYSEAAKLKEEITKETGDEYERVWSYANRRLELAGNAIQSKYDAVAEAYKSSASYGGGINPTGGAGATSSGSSSSSSSSSSSATTVIVNGDRSNVSAEKTPKLTPTISQETKSVQFKIVSPTIRTGTGEVLCSDNSVTLYGFIDDPGSGKTLSIDGLETSWDAEGIFSRTVSLPKEINHIKIRLYDKKGQQAEQILKIRKTEKKNESEGKKEPAASVELRKRALVIGNSDYKHLSVLKNPRNDAKDMSQILKEIGFDVTTLYDASFDQIREEVGKLSKNKDESDVVLFFFAGHGLEIDGENFLMPVDVKSESPDQVKLNSLSVTRLTKVMEIRNDDKLNIIILDACRNNPFPSSSRSSAGGLARTTPASGMLIAYATSPGKTASDGSGENGLYTGELIKQMSIPQRIEDVFMNTRNEVERKSRNAQKPWEEARLRGVFYLKSE